jgi:hypothetical protein
MTEQHEPGKPWICEEGQRHFICFGCRNLFTTNPEQTEEARNAETRANMGEEIPEGQGLSVCDDCYPILLDRARKAGLIP